MKKHIIVNNKLLNTNKKWSDLKLKQKEYILNLIREICLAFVKDNIKIPNKKEKEELLSNIYSKIVEEDIWIPFREIENQFTKKYNKYINKSLSKERRCII